LASYFEFAPTRMRNPSVGRKSDLVTSILNRLGNLGILLIACALLLGGLAGAAVVHHYDRPAADTIAIHPGNSGNAPGQNKPNKPHGNQKHPNQGHHGTPDGGQAETD
jgi:hypothetical protein